MNWSHYTFQGKASPSLPKYRAISIKFYYTFFVFTLIIPMETTKTGSELGSLVHWNTQFVVLLPNFESFQQWLFSLLTRILAFQKYQGP